MVTAGPILKKVPIKTYKKLSYMYPKILKQEKTFSQVRANSVSYNKNVFMGGQRLKTINPSENVSQKKKEIKKIVEVS